MTKKLVDFGFSSPKISPENVCESGQQNLRPNVHKSWMFHDVRPTYLKIGTFWPTSICFVWQLSLSNFSSVRFETCRFCQYKWSTALWHLTFFRCLVLKTKRDIVGGEKRESLGWNSEWSGKQVSWCLMIAGVESCPAELYKLWGRKWEWTPPGRKPWAFTKQHPYTNFAVKTEQHTEKFTKKWKFWLKKKQVLFLEQCWPGLD